MPDSAAQDDEQDFSIPGSDEADQGGIAGAPQNGAPDPQAAPPQGQATQPPPAAQQPKVSGRTAFLGNLLKAVMSGIQNAPGNPNNAFDRGYMQNSPQNQQKQKTATSQALSEADTAKANSSIAQMKALNYKYMMQRQSTEQQNKDVDALSQFTQKVIDEHGEVQSESDDPKAATAEAARLRGTDPRVKAGTGDVFMMPHRDGKGGTTYSVLYVPHAGVTQDDQEFDNPYYDPDAKDGILSQEKFKVPAGTQTNGVPKFIDQLNKAAQAKTKQDSSDYAAIAKMPESTPADVLAKKSKYDSEKNSNTHHFQQNADLTNRESARLGKLHDQMQTDKLNEAHAGRADAAAQKAEGSAKAGEDALNYANTYLKEEPSGPGDEALMEKFFELAKPSTGFRMSQPQIDMLKNARSWMDSAEAKTRHATDGTWFSQKQRQQIAHTMSDLAGSKGGAAKVPQRPSGVPAQAVWNPESRQWRLPQ